MSRVWGTARTHFVFVLVISHEYISGYYRVSVYFLSKILSDILTLRTLPGLVFSCVAYFMIGGCFFLLSQQMICSLLTVIKKRVCACEQVWSPRPMPSSSSCSPWSWCPTLPPPWLWPSPLIRRWSPSPTSSWPSPVSSWWYQSCSCAHCECNLCVSPMSFCPLQIFAGLLVNLPSIVSWLAWLKYLSIPRYGLSVRSLSHTRIFILTLCLLLSHYSTSRVGFFQALQINEFSNLKFCDGLNSNATAGMT